MHFDLPGVGQMSSANLDVTALMPLQFDQGDLMYLPVSGDGGGGSGLGVVTFSVQGAQETDGGVEDRPLTIVRTASQDPAISINAESEAVEFRPGPEIAVRESPPPDDQLPDYVIAYHAPQNGSALAPTPPGEVVSPLPLGESIFAYGLSVGEEEGIVIVNSLPGGEESIIIVGGQPGEHEGIVIVNNLPGGEEGIVIVNSRPGPDNIVSGILQIPALTQMELLQNKPLLLDGIAGIPPGIKPLFIPTSGPSPSDAFLGLLLQSVKTAESFGWLAQKAALAPADGGGYILFTPPPDDQSDPFQILAAAQVGCSFQSGREGGIAPCTLPPGFISSSGMPGQLIVGFSLDAILAGQGVLVDLLPPPACVAGPTQTPGPTTTLLPGAGAFTPTNTPILPGDEAPTPTPNYPLPFPTPTHTPVPPSDEEPTPTRESGRKPTPTDCPIDPETGEELCG
jgi:hypothetical protein